MSESFLICEQCGTENPSGSTFCLICGHDLSLPKSPAEEMDDELDQTSNLPGDIESDLPELLRDLKAENPSGSIRRSALFSQDDAEKTRAVSIRPTEANAEKEDWIERVRKKAQEDGIQKVDPEEPTESHDQGTDAIPELPQQAETDQWLGKVKETANRDGLHTSLPPKDDPEDSLEGTPGWLKKVREQVSAEQESIAPEDETQGKPSRPYAEWIREEIHKDPQELIKAEATQPVQIEEPVSSQSGLEADTPEPGQSFNDDQHNGDVPKPMPEENSNDPKQDHIEITSTEPQIEAFWRDFDRDPAEEILKEQRVRADLIKSLLVTEGKSVEIPAPVEKKKTLWLRFFLAIILLGAVIGPLFFNSGTFSQKGSLSPSGQAFYNQVEQLEVGSKVLVVLDYPAGLSAELESVSKPVFAHLAQKDLDMSLLSIQPEGNWLSQHLLENLRMSLDLEGISNLGYLPGNQLGLLRLAGSTSDALLLDLPTLPERSLGFSLADFDCLVLVTDSLQTTRNWVELVYPVLEEKAKLVVSSMQEALVIMPYFDSKQVDGILAGVQESNQYAAAVGNETQQPATWRSYQAGLLVMAGLMLVGIVIRLEAAASSENELREIEH